MNVRNPGVLLHGSDAKICGQTDREFRIESGFFQKEGLRTATVERDIEGGIICCQPRSHIEGGIIQYEFFLCIVLANIK